MKHLLVIAFALMVGSVAYAGSDARYGKQADETAREYEARICEARKTWEEAATYIDSNMIWADNRDFRKTMENN